MARIRAAIVFLVLLLVTLVFLPFQLLAIWLRPSVAGVLPMWWQKIAARLLGLTVTVEGSPVAQRPLLILANHVSWLDIVTFGSVLPASFVAKSEVATWPVVNWLARLQRSIFIDRVRRTSAQRSNEAIASRLVDGDAIVLFAEGTTGDGISVLPFRSALVGAAREAAGDGGEMVVQPVAIVYTALHGLPIGRLRMADVAWHGDMDLAPHLLGVIGIGSIDAVVAFGEPMTLSAEADRKKVTAKAEAEVRAMVRSIRARRGPKPTAKVSDVPAILTGAESG